MLGWNGLVPDGIALLALLQIKGVSEGLFMKYLAIFFREENVTQKYETRYVKSYFTKQLLFIIMRNKKKL